MKLMARLKDQLMVLGLLVTINSYLLMNIGSYYIGGSSINDYSKMPSIKHLDWASIKMCLIYFK
jgi:hypothetical protein